MYEKRKWSFEKHERGSTFFETSKTFIVRVCLCVGGLVGGLVGGDKKGPSIFLIFTYVDKQDAVLLNLASKFQIFKLKLLNPFDLIAVDNF